MIFFASISSVDDKNVPLPNFVPKTDATISKIVIRESEIIE